MMVGWYLFIYIIGALRARDKDARQKSEESVLDLHGCMYVLHEAVRMVRRVADTVEANRKFRITLHRVNGDVLEQVVPYFGGDGLASKGVGRKFPIRAGIIGQVARTGEGFVVTREEQDDAAYQRDLVKVWGFTKEEADTISRNRLSAMAVPVGKDPIIAVLYADSNDKTFFDDNIQVLITATALGIAKFTDVRYRK